MNDDHDARWTYKLNRISRGSHRLGLLLAAVIVAAGLLLMVKDAMGLRLWDLTLSDIPILGANITIVLIGIGLVAVAAYGIVRALGWAIGKSI